jgi:hypothetical protein
MFFKKPFYDEGLLEENKHSNQSPEAKFAAPMTTRTNDHASGGGIAKRTSLFVIINNQNSERRNIIASDSV